MPIDHNVFIGLALCLVPLFQQNQRGALLFVLLAVVWLALGR